MLWNENNSATSKVIITRERIYLLLHNDVVDRDNRYSSKIVVYANRRHQFREFSIHHSHLLCYCTYKCDSYTQKIVNVKKKTKKNRKNHISHFLKMNRLALKEDWGEWVEENSMKIVFQLMTHRLHALNIFHVPYSQKNASLVSRSFQCTQKRKEHGKGEKFWVDCGNEMPCGDFFEIYSIFEIEKISKFLTRTANKKGGWRIDGWLIYYARVLSNARHL